MSTACTCTFVQVSIGFAYVSYRKVLSRLLTATRKPPTLTVNGFVDNRHLSYGCRNTRDTRDRLLVSIYTAEPGGYNPRPWVLSSSGWQERRVCSNTGVRKHVCDRVQVQAVLREP